MDMPAKWEWRTIYSTVPRPLLRPSERQRSEQNFTSFQQRSHFLRQEKGRPQPAQGLDGRSVFSTRLPT